MKYTVNNPAREFTVGAKKNIVLKDCAHIELEPDEQVTFTGPEGIEYDVTRKSWGFYATPSLNGRLPRHNLSPALIQNAAGQFFVLLAAKEKRDEFHRYLSEEALELICWLDQSEALAKIAGAFSERG